jgi:hypothetical protein
MLVANLYGNDIWQIDSIWLVSTRIA